MAVSSRCAPPTRTRCRSPATCRSWSNSTSRSPSARTDRREAAVSPAAGWLAERLGLSLSDPALLDRALTHRSHGSTNNERLEYLGDAVLTFVVAEMLYRTFPDASEGELSRFRASLVSGEALAGIASTLGIGDHLRLGEGEMKSGGQRRATILADALEAVFGGVFLDQGLGAARRA